MTTIRLCKIAAIFTLGVLFFIITINNIFDYQSNFDFVVHVLKMDTVFQTNRCLGRSIQSPYLHHLAYWTIILAETICSALCLFGAFRLYMAVKLPARIFNIKKGPAAIGLMTGFLLMVLGFMTIGGEWFFMWQSEKWSSGLTSALRMAVICGLTFLFLIHSDADRDIQES